MDENHLEFYKRWNSLAQPYFKWQVDQFRPYIGKRIADIGCGPGNITGQFLDSEFYLGIDLNLKLIEHLRNQFISYPSINGIVGDIHSEELQENLKKNRIDTIMCFNLLEHLEDDLGAINNLAKSTQSGNYLNILVPALPQIYGTLDQLDGHYRRYTTTHLKSQLDKFPLKIIKLQYFNLIGVFGWYLKGKILKQKHHSDDNYKMMNLLIPVMSKLEAWKTPPVGMSVIAVCQKK